MGKTEKPRNKCDRVDVYYFTPKTNLRMRSLNDVEKFCKENKLIFDPNQFSFQPETIHPNLIDKTTSDDSGDANFTCHSPENLDEELENVFIHECYNVEVPSSYNESQDCQDKSLWDKAMSDELNMMEERHVWKLVDPPQNQTVLGSKWVYTIKKNEANVPVKYKARLVCQGFRQKPGIDYNEVFCPVINFNIVKLLFILLVCMLKWYHCQIDICSAYLYGILKEPVYMKQPTGYEVRGSEHKVCLLTKSIYGLHQSAREFNNTLDSTLKELGFTKVSWCNCLYRLNDAILIVYIDDMVLFCKSKEYVNEVLSLVKSKLDITELGATKYLLGVNFETIGNSIFLHQKTYVERLMLKFKDLPKGFVTLPLKVGCTLPSKVKDDEIVETDIMKSFPYRSMIGSLLFLATRSRCDISFSVNVLSQYCNGYTYKHWCYVVDLMNYVFSTKDYKINLSNISGNELIAFSDANWGSSLTNRHSSSGHIILFGNVPFSWKSSKQRCIALSTMESEFIALTESVKELVWYSRILNELNLIESVKPKQYCDNEAAIYFVRNNPENLKTKHIDIKYQFIRQLINEKLFDLEFVSSRNNLADFLTKPLLVNKFKVFLNNIFCNV